MVSVNVDQTVVSDKFKHNDDGFKYFIGYKEGEIIKPLCIMLPQISGYIKYFENGGRNMSILINFKYDRLLYKYNEIWEKIKGKLNIKFYSMPVYYEKYIKAKVRKFDGVIKANFLGDKIPKESVHYACIPCITFDSVMKVEKRRMEKRNKKEIKISKFITIELESDSESELESDSE